MSPAIPDTEGAAGAWSLRGQPAAARLAIRSFWIVPLTFYAYTACRGTGWIDAPMIARNVYELRTGTWVNVHNLFHFLGRIWSLIVPVADLHRSLNLLCAVLGAVTVHFVFLTGVRITRNPAAAGFGAIALMVSHSLWWHSTMLEVYTLNTALMAAMLYCLARYDDSRALPDLYRAVFLFGLGISNHVLMALFAIAFAGWFLVPSQWAILRRPRVLLTVLFFLIVGSQLYLTVFVEAYARQLRAPERPTFSRQVEVLEGLADRMTGGHFRGHMFPETMSARTKWSWRLNYVFTWAMNYPSVAFPLGLVGLWAFWKQSRYRSTCVFFGLGMLAQAIWSSNYMIWDMYAFGLPVWVLFGLSVILGTDHVYRLGRGARPVLVALAPTILLAPLLYAQIVVWAAEPGFWRKYFSRFDYVSNLWNPARYFANPNKRDYLEADHIAQSVLAQLPPGAHVFDDDGKGYYPVSYYYQTVLGRRPDVEYHNIVTSVLDRERIRDRALRIKGLLDEGLPVYVSSPYWPERPVLDDLYGLLAAEAGQRNARPWSLSIERLEATFPGYVLRRIPLSDRDPFFIYMLVPRE